MVSDFAIGLIACGISSIFFGTMFVPIKPFDLRDGWCCQYIQPIPTCPGLFVQFMQAGGIMFIGTIVYIIRGYPVFYPLAALAGVIWATGIAFNVHCAVYIVIGNIC